MNDCLNVEVREALPELVHGMLPEPERDRVQEHVADCDDCAAELAIIRAVRAATPVVNIDVIRIASAIPPYRRRSPVMKRVYLELAAACLVGAVGISALVMHKSHSTGALPAASSATAVSGGSSAGLVLVNTSDLSDDGLAQLTRELDQLQALPTADPESVTPPALELPSGAQRARGSA